MSRSIRRVLFRAAVAGPAATVIHLDRPLLTGSSALPADSDGPSSNACCLGLLQVGFTEPPQSPEALVVSYTTVSPLPKTEILGGLFSVALSRGSLRVAVGHHLALWSPDVPRQEPRRALTRPPDRLIHVSSLSASNAGVCVHLPLLGVLRV
jgi:hypothetical protein